MIEAGQWVSGAYHFNMRLLRKRGYHPVHVRLGPMLWLTEDEIAAAIHEHADRQVRPGLRCQPGRDGGPDRVVFPLKHQHVDASGCPVDDLLKGSECLIRI